jgi:hypothetical protein
VNGEASLRWLNRDEPDIDEVVGAIERIMSEADRATR